jgi:hypothetical protein
MKKIELALILLLTAFYTSAQPVSELVYEIKPNEKVIHLNEHRLSFEAGKKGYILFVERYEDGDTNQYMIRNGVESGPYDLIYDPEISWNYSETGFYWFVFHQGEKLFMNMNGTVYGPYDDIGPRGGWYHPIIDETGQFMITFIRDEKEWYNVNGKEYGPYESALEYCSQYGGDCKLGKNGKFLFLYTDDGKVHFNISGRVFGPYDEINTYYDMVIEDFDKGHYIFKVKDGDQQFVIANEKLYGPYKLVDRMSVDPERGFIFSYNDNSDQYFYNVNGTDYGPYQSVESVGDASGNFVQYTKNNEKFIDFGGKTYGPESEISKVSVFRDQIAYVAGETGSKYVFVNGQKYGPYSEFESYYITQNENGFAYVYRDVNDQMQYANVNGKIFGPFSMSYPGSVDFILKPNGVFMFHYSDQNKYYVNVCGKILGPYSSIQSGLMDVFSQNNFYFRYSENDHLYVNHSEKIYGPYNSVYTFTVNNDQLWFNAEGKKGDYTVMNGAQAGPFESVWWKTEEERGQGIFYYIQKDKRYRVENGVSSLILDQSVQSEKDEWQTLYDDYEYTNLEYSYKTGQVLCNGKMYEGAAVDAFNFYLDHTQDSYRWFSLKGNQLWSHSLPEKL